MKKYLNNYFSKLNKLTSSIDEKELLKTIKLIKKIKKNNKKIIIVGNGGSAAIANHFMTDVLKNTKIKNMFLKTTLYVV